MLKRELIETFGTIGVQARLRQVLATDPVLTIGQLERRVDLILKSARFRPNPAEWAALLGSVGFALTERQVGTSVGARVKSLEVFVCSSTRVATLTDWNLRQLAGLAAVRYGLGVRAEHWQLRALERTNTHMPIPDAMIRLVGDKPATATYRPPPLPVHALVALEWDSGSATRTELVEKIRSYAATATCQIWAAPTLKRAMTIHELLSHHLEPGHLATLAVDWRSGQAIDLMLPDRGTVLFTALSRVVPLDAPWGVLC